MEIKTQITNDKGRKYEVLFKNGDPDIDQRGEKLNAIHGFCFCEGKFVVVRNGSKNRWTPPGGGIENGETYQEALVREVKEESNMKVLKQECIGYQVITTEGKEPEIQVRSFCMVEPQGEFVSDPDEDITEIKLIDPKDYKQYFDWGEIGDHIMKRALELFEKSK